MVSDRNSLSSPEWKVHHLGDLQLLVDMRTLKIDMMFKPHGNDKKINSLKTVSIFGMHDKCSKNLTFVEGMIVCETCKEVIPSESI